MNEPVTVEAALSHLPSRAAMMAAIEVLLSGPVATRRVTPLVARRIAACLDAWQTGTVAALENGSPVA